MGGEKRLRAWPSALHTGSPPRGRGKVVLLCIVRFGQGITPAWAGKSVLRCLRMRRIRDHPRVGGEKLSLTVSVQHDMGSPPRGRGKGRILPCRVGAQGITPAWAGKSCSTTCYCCLNGDHPRVGGEKSLGFMLWQIWRGSPPRGRGKGPRPGSKPVLTRITPAWAGKS